jgi:hypothetical protein
MHFSFACMTAIYVQVQNFSLAPLADAELRRPQPKQKTDAQAQKKVRAKMPGFFRHQLHVCNYLVKHAEAGSPIIGEVSKKLILATPGPPTGASGWDLDLNNIRKWYDYVHDRRSTSDLYCWSTSLMKHTK